MKTMEAGAKRAPRLTALKTRLRALGARLKRLNFAQLLMLMLFISMAAGGTAAVVAMISINSARPSKSYCQKLSEWRGDDRFLLRSEFSCFLEVEFDWRPRAPSLTPPRFITERWSTRSAPPVAKPAPPLVPVPPPPRPPARDLGPR